MHDYNFEEESVNCEPQNIHFIENKKFILEIEFVHCFYVLRLPNFNMKNYLRHFLFFCIQRSVVSK